MTASLLMDFGLIPTLFPKQWVDFTIFGAYNIYVHLSKTTTSNEAVRGQRELNDFKWKYIQGKTSLSLEFKSLPLS